jgi:hypothetical protein
MDRKLVTREELLAILNEELKKREGMENYSFTSVGYELVEPDAEGCNWSTPVLRGSGVPLEPCIPIARRVVEEARKKYNLK